MEAEVRDISLRKKINMSYFICSNCSLYLRCYATDLLQPLSNKLLCRRCDFTSSAPVRLQLAMQKKCQTTPHIARHRANDRQCYPMIGAFPLHCDIWPSIARA